MGNSRPARENHGRKHRLAQKPQWGSTVFKAFVACVTAFALMVPATTLIAIAADDDGGFNSQPTDVGTPSADDKDASKSKEAEDKDASKSSESAESKDSADKSKEAEGKDASKSSESADKSKEAEDKDASKSSESAESKDSADKSKEAEGKDASKSSESADKSKSAKKMPAQSFKKELTTENDKKITVSVEAPEGAFPEGTTMKVKAVEASEVEDAVKSAVSEKTSEKVTEMQAVDITFYNKDGKEIEPAKEITVKFVSDLIKKDDEPLVVHVDDEGEADVVKPLSDDELKDRDKKVKDNELLIDSDQFSVYVLACTTMITTDVLTADGKTYKITVECGEDAQIPEGSKLVVKEILSDANNYLEYLNKATEALKKEKDNGATVSNAGNNASDNASGDAPNNASVSYARFFDIEIHNEADEKIEPSAPVQVKVELADAPEAAEDSFEVLHFEDDADVPVAVESETSTDESDSTAEVAFKAASFSVWAVLTTNASAPTDMNNLDGWSVAIDVDGRYMTSEVLDSEVPTRIGKSDDPSKAAVWTFEFRTGQYGPAMYSISCIGADGKKYYLQQQQVAGTNNYRALTLVSAEDVPLDQTTGFFVEKRNDWTQYNGRYRIYFYDPYPNRYSLNEMSNADGNGFFAYLGDWQDNPGEQLHFTFSKNGAEPSMNDRATSTYAVIVKKPGTNEYYSVQEDGSLMEAKFDERAGVVRVGLEEPFAWTYQSTHDGLDDNTFYSPWESNHPDWEPYNIRAPYDARGLDPVSKLKNSDYFVYLTSESSSGIDRETKESPSHGAHKWANGIRYENNHVSGITWNDGTSSFDSTDHYIGADFDGMKITGEQPESNAATIFFARIERVPNVGSNNETVSHIDIGIKAKATLKAPLAYGKYYDAEGNVILDVPESQNITLTLTKDDVEITKEDIMGATLKAYAGDEEIDDAFYITGYSANDNTAYSTVQVRMEGSFKVTTLAPYQGSGRSNDDSNRRTERLNNKIDYEISLTKKDIEFPLVYEGKQLYDANGNALKLSGDLPIVEKFNYWSLKDEQDDKSIGNECPPLQPTYEDKFRDLIADTDQWGWYVGRNYDNWRKGVIIDNDTYGGYPPYPGDSGMDFILQTEGEVDSRITAVEIKKQFVDTDGNPITLGEKATSTFNLYYNENASNPAVANVAGFAVSPDSVADDNADLKAKQEGYTQLDGSVPVTVPAGADNEILYDYNVDQGMYYVTEKTGENPVIKDENGQLWKYKETRIETEYVWRADDNTDKTHVVKGHSSVPEVAGLYAFDGWESEVEKDDDGNPIHPFNGFLEFDAYNVYEPVYGDLRIDKTVSGQGATSSEPVTFVFEIKDVETDGKKYHNFASLTYTGTSPDSTTVTHIPAGLEVEVNEVAFDGCGYQVVSGNGSKATIVASDEVEAGADMASVAFTNELGPVHGHGIQNNFELTEGNKWVWNKPTVVAGDSADEQ